MVEAVGPLSENARQADGYPLVVIVGPTASGKSALALRLAEVWGGEIVNYDSVQLYCGFNIGSGKLPREERRGIPHHLLDCVEPDRTFTAGDYRREACQVLAEVRERRKLPILAGGTGLYLRALLLGLFEGPARSEGLRARLRALAERRGREFLHRLLARLDPPTAERVAPRDTQKVIRAVEVCLLGRQPFSAQLHRGRSGLSGFKVFKIGLEPQRAQLYQRINDRVERMFAGGLLEETRELLTRMGGARTSGATINPVQVKPLVALGYRQACQTLAGKMRLQDAICDTQAATRRYAKRQTTWLRRETEVTWFAGFGDDSDLQERVLRSLGAVKPLGTNELMTASARSIP